MKRHSGYSVADIAPRLRDLRRRQGKTQHALAAELGVSLSHWSKLETGVGGISRQLIRLICERFDVSEQWLLTGEGRAYTGEIQRPAGRPPAEGHCGPSVELVTRIAQIMLDDEKRAAAEVMSRAMKITMPEAWAVMIERLLRK